MSSSLFDLKQRLWKILPRANTPFSVIGDWQDQQHAATRISSDPSFISAPKLFTVWWWSEWCLGNLRVKPEFLAFPAAFASTGWLRTYLRDMSWAFFHIPSTTDLLWGRPVPWHHNWFFPPRVLFIQCCTFHIFFSTFCAFHIFFSTVLPDFLWRQQLFSFPILIIVGI